jgi:endothelin-converting enzyme
VKIKAPFILLQVDGNETLGDNICDNAGLRHSWLAYQAWQNDHGREPGLPGVRYSVEEMFFITYGQVF